MILSFSCPTHITCFVQLSLTINLLYTDGFFLLICHSKFGIVHYTYLGVSDFNFKRLYSLFKDHFTLTNNVDPDEMQHYAAFHLGLHCLQKYSFRGFPNAKG